MPRLHHLDTRDQLLYGEGDGFESHRFSSGIGVDSEHGRTQRLGLAAAHSHYYPG